MMKYHTTAMVCRYVQAKLKLSGRSMARLLNVHHSVWQRYLAGTRRPGSEGRGKLAALMKVEKFRDLVGGACRAHIHNIKRKAYGENMRRSGIRIPSKDVK